MSKKMIYASPKGEKIVFDNWTENEEFEGLWVDLCPECLSKYQDILKGKLDDAGSGTAACSVYGCSNFNAGCYADFSSDEVTFEDHVS